MDTDLLKYLKQFVLPRRFETIEKIVADRTKYITVLLEDLYHSQNASAVLRSCECFGIHDVHVVEKKSAFQVCDAISMGSSKWLNIQSHQPPKSSLSMAIAALKSSGYRIVATTPHTQDVNLCDFDLSKGKVALLFGNELDGLSSEALALSDEFVKIPLLGFTESFNISVAAGIVLHQLSLQLRSSQIDWKLNPDEYNQVLYGFLMASIRNSKQIVKHYYSISTSK